MLGPDSLTLVPETPADRRVRIFRRSLSIPGAFDAMQIDAYIVITDHYVVICDTLCCPEDAQYMLQSVSAELASRQLLVINSHADWDHAWGNCCFTRDHAVPILAHSACRTRLSSVEARTELANYQHLSPLFEHVTLSPPTLTFSNHFSIYGGDLTLECLPAPGHTSDSIALWLPEIHLLLAFDAVENPIPLLENAQSFLPMCSTLERFLALQPQVVLCSHGQTTGVTTIIKNLAYLRTIEQHCRTWLTTHRFISSQSTPAATLIDFPLEAAVTDPEHISDRSFYLQAHNDNIRAVLQWLRM